MAATVDNDATIELYGRVAVAQAAAGADIVAPSGMMDGQVLAIREALDEEGFDNVAILAYAAKYASALYGPFRDAVDVTIVGGGDRRGYQQDSRNAREALEEIRADLAEGADMVMVKPALAYLDVIARARMEVDVPLAAYHVSGEYAMVMAAAANGWIDGSGGRARARVGDQAGGRRRDPHVLRPFVGRVARGDLTCPTNEELFARAQHVIPGGVDSPVRAFNAVGGTPYFVARAEGRTSGTSSGRRYLDLVQSYGAIIAGHAHPAIVEAVQRAASDGTSYGAPTEREVLLAEAIIERVPSVDLVRFVSSGTEATMSAIRVARGFTGRPDGREVRRQLPRPRRPPPCRKWQRRCRARAARVRRRDRRCRA